jgi:hypothetical protein
LHQPAGLGSAHEPHAEREELDDRAGTDELVVDAVRIEGRRDNLSSADRF